MARKAEAAGLCASFGVRAAAKPETVALGRAGKAVAPSASVVVGAVWRVSVVVGAVGGLFNLPSAIYSFPADFWAVREFAQKSAGNKKQELH